MTREDAKCPVTLKWKRITKQMSRTGPYLVTNNLKARDAFGRMSHVWLTGFIQKSSEPERNGEFTCFDSGYRQISNLTHYIELELS